MECLGLHNKPKAEVDPGHMLTGPKEEEEEEEEEETVFGSAVRSFRVNKWKQATKFLLPYQCRGTIFTGRHLFRLFNRIFVDLVRT
jgi:hypothetical protein